MATTNNTNPGANTMQTSFDFSAAAAAAPTCTRSTYFHSSKGHLCVECGTISADEADAHKARRTAESLADPRNVPVVGEGATFTLYTDSSAYTVISVSKSGKTAVLQRDKATLLNGPSSGADDALVMTPGGFAAHTTGKQRYSYERDTNGRTIKVTRRTCRNGEIIWKQAGSSTKSRGCVARFGYRAEHYDYNF